MLELPQENIGKLSKQNTAKDCASFCQKINACLCEQIESKL